MLVACMPRMALCGGLMMGVESMLPNTPPLLQGGRGAVREEGAEAQGLGTLRQACSAAPHPD